MQIEAFFDERTWTLTYLVHRGGDGVVIDPVLDFAPGSGRTWTESAERVAARIDALGLRVSFVLETHTHADHLSAMPFFRERYGAVSATGSLITGIQAFFADLFGLGEDFPTDGSQFDILLDDEQVLDAGSFGIRALHTPGHTPACLSYLIEDALFSGDTLFQPDYGTARCDFPNGSPGDLYDSIQRLFQLPDPTRVFTGHDYQPGGRAVQYESTIAEQCEHNVQLSARTTREEFIAFRRRRDAGLSMPALILPSIQVNIRAGELPPPEPNGRSYLRIPLNVFGDRS